MYWYKTNEGKKYFLSDNSVTDNPINFFNGENIIEWGHRRDDDNVIDAICSRALDDDDWDMDDLDDDD